MDAIEKQLETNCTNMENKLDDRFNQIESMFHQLMSTTTTSLSVDSSIAQETNMDYAMTRDESLLKRKVIVNNTTSPSAINDPSMGMIQPNLLHTQPDEYCEGNAAKIRK
jgi:hypothetical protein